MFQATANIPIPLPTTPNTATPIGFKLKPSTKGVENAKKRLRAFSIQKKTPITPVPVNKPVPGTSSKFLFYRTGVKLMFKKYIKIYISVLLTRYIVIIVTICNVVRIKTLMFTILLFI